MTALLDPRLADCRRLFVRDHELIIGIGVHEFEKAQPQRVLVNIDVYVPLAHSTPTRDALEEVVDYDLLHRAVAARAGRPHVGLQETLADEIARELLAHPAVRAVRVSTEKTDVYPDCDAVGVEVFHLKENPA